MAVSHLCHAWISWYHSKILHLQHFRLARWILSSSLWESPSALFQHCSGRQPHYRAFLQAISFFVTFEVCMHQLTSLEEDVKPRRVVIFPRKTFDLPSKLRRVVRPPTHIKHLKVFAMLFSQKSCHLWLDNWSAYVLNGVAIEFLKALSWKGHCQDPLRYICDVQVVLVVLEAHALTTYDLSKPIHFY